MLALLSLLYWVFGIIGHLIAPLVTPILKDLNISYSQMGIILGSWPLSYIGAAAIGGAVIDRWGIRKSLFIGVLIVGLSGLLRYFVTGFTTMFLCVALFGLGGPLISIGSPKTISLWFTGRERGTAVGIYSAAGWVGSLTAYSTANSIVMPLTGYSWRLTFLCYGVIAFAAALLWVVLAKDVQPEETEKKTGLFKVLTGLIGRKNVRLIVMMGFLSFSISHGMNDWLPKILETGGFPPASAGIAASIPLLVGIPTVLCVPRLVKPHFRGSIVAMLSLGIAMAVLTVVNASDGLLIAGLILYGICFSPIVALTILILMELPEVGARYMGSAGGMFFCISEIGGFAGPSLVGAVRDVTGSFLIGAFFLTVLAITISMMAFSLRIHPAIRP